jgi:hypothetical protein
MTIPEGVTMDLLRKLLEQSMEHEPDPSEEPTTRVLGESWPPQRVAERLRHRLATRVAVLSRREPLRDRLRHAVRGRTRSETATIVLWLAGVPLDRKQRAARVSVCER